MCLRSHSTLLIQIGGSREPPPRVYQIATLLASFGGLHMRSFFSGADVQKTKSKMICTVCLARCLDMLSAGHSGFLPEDFRAFIE